MKKLMLAFILVASIAIAGSYYIMVDASGYVIGISVFGASDPRYNSEPVTCEIPDNINCGCYKYLGGRFILDEEKYAEWIAENTVPASGT